MGTHLVAAQDGADFLSDVVASIVATKAGDDHNFYGRWLAVYMDRHLPDSSLVVRNMPGSGRV